MAGWLTTSPLNTIIAVAPPSRLYALLQPMDVKTCASSSSAKPGPLSVTLRLPRKPAKLTLEPGGVALPFAYRGGEARLTVPSLDIHRVIVAE